VEEFAWHHHCLGTHKEHDAAQQGARLEGQLRDIQKRLDELMGGAKSAKLETLSMPQQDIFTVSGAIGTASYAWTTGNGDYFRTGTNKGKPKYTNNAQDTIKWETGNDWGAQNLGTPGKAKWIMVGNGHHRYFNEAVIATPPVSGWLMRSGLVAGFMTLTYELNGRRPVYVSPDAGLPGECGFNVDCPLDFSLAEVNRSAELSEAEKNGNSKARIILRDRQSKACESAADIKNNILETGGWCYEKRGSTLLKANGRDIDMDYLIPLHHVGPDDVMVSTLAERVLLKEDGSCCYSLTDIGAGVGQYGHALKARHPELEYYGYDGAGNVEDFTGKYVQFIDLTKPLSLKRTDWLLSLEVGEHIPHKHEAQVIANLHAHNCRGAIVSWAVLSQTGTGHINCHSNEYVINVFENLGYKLNQDITAALRGKRTRNLWFCGSAMAFDRITKPASCTE